jgi:3-phenylpropionate/trans-cinnamate dioxygenase ferredoxin reductase subunit
MSTVLIVGAGLAGARTAETLRSLGFDGRIVLAGDEPHPPYERPSLSKEFLAGTRDHIELRPREQWRRLGIELRLGSRVERVRGREVLVGTERVHWDHLVLATGARARRGGGLRTLVDARRLRTQLRRGARLAIVGAGFIGCEVASTARTLGVEVTLVEASDAPLARILGCEVGALLAERIRSHGVDLRLGTTDIPAHDVLLWATGVRPDNRLIAELRVDPCGRTQYRDVYAAGDVTGTGHWTAAAGQAVAVANAVLGRDRPYLDPPYVWSDQFGLRLQIVGDPSHAADIDLEVSDDAFRADYRDAAGRPVATVLANRPADVAAVRRHLAVRSGRSGPPAAEADIAA